jgi:hypothetical protein
MRKERAVLIEKTIKNSINYMHGSRQNDPMRARVKAWQDLWGAVKRWRFAAAVDERGSKLLYPNLVKLFKDLTSAITRKRF